MVLDFRRKRDVLATLSTESDRFEILGHKHL